MPDGMEEPDAKAGQSLDKSDQISDGDDLIEF